MCGYKRLSIEERDRIAIWRGEGRSIRAIASQLGRDPSTVSRELRRNARGERGEDYLPHLAQWAAEWRMSHRHRRPRLKAPALRDYVRRKLRQGWSPEQIAGWLPNDELDLTISHEAIYQWIYTEARAMIAHLVRGHRKRQSRRFRKHSRSLIPSRVSIQERPAVVSERQQVGHWEVDTVHSRQGEAALAVLAERKTRYLKIRHLPLRSAKGVRLAVVRALSQYPPHLRRSLTYDNGTENCDHLKTNAALGTRSFFCEPYHSWEKGTVENSIGLIRRYFPKGTDFAQVSKNQVRWVEKQLNHRPRKCLNYQTPAEAFRKERCT